MVKCKTQRLSVIFLAALIALGTALRAYQLDSGLWYDEIVTLVESARPPLMRIVTEFPGNNNHPLYSIFAHLSISAFGEHPWTVRLPAVVFGVAAIPMLFGLGLAVTSRLEAMLAATVLTVSYHHVWFSQNARGYTALLLWTLLSTYLFLQLVARGRMRHAVAYGLAVALGTYTHLTMAFVAVAHALTWTAVVWSRHERSERARDLKAACWAFGVAGGGAALAYLPLAWQVYTFFGGTPQATASIATPSWAILETVKGLRIGLGAGGVLLATVLAAFGFLAYWRQQPLIAIAFSLPAPVTVAAMLVMHAPLRPRFLINLMGFAVLFIVRGGFDVARRLARFGVTEGTRYRVGLATVGMVVVVSICSLPDAYRYPKQDFEGAVRFVNAHRAPGETVVTAGTASYPLTRYYRLPWRPVEEVREIERLRWGGERVWLVYASPDYMDAALVATLRHHCVPQRVLRGTLGGGDVIVCTIDRPLG